ncbi:phage gp29-like protein [Ancylobacter sp. 3268]|uniref:DUF935 domain-containing protein n=1 Tax=Ancylobacter sp. 3268 TaxID=2817752 RepID=UPI002858D564|nr:DUF935 family protein [Ancylobacter sp. 3268]MDR6952665.1 phage gp29-like protein [Ancylobacter sp. 3268]
MSKRSRRRDRAKASFAAPAGAPRVSADMTRMLATPGNDITIPNYGDVLRSEDETILRRGGVRGIRLYDEVLRDGHALAVLNKRTLKVVSREWTVTPASERPIDVAAAELVERQIKRIGFDRLCRELLGAVLYGYSVAEIEWAVGGGEIFPKRIVGHQRARFVFDREWEPRLLTHANTFEGEALPARKFIVHRHDAEGSDPYGRGLGRVLFWHVLFKREGVGFWAHFLEKYASPTPVAKYPFGTPPTEQEKLLRHLLDLVQKGALVVPMGTDVEFLEAARSGAATYEEWCRFWDEQTSVAVLGETLSTNLQGVGARAATETHDDVSSRIADADGDLLTATLTDTLAKWVTEFNVPGAEPPSIWRLRPKNEGAIEDVRTKKADRAKKELDTLFDLAGKGYRPAEGLEKSLTEIMGVDVVADPLLKGQFGPPPALRSSALGATALTPDFAAHDDHGLADILDQLGPAGEEVLAAWIARAKAAVADADARSLTLPAVKDLLLRLAGDIVVTPLGEVLAPALTLAELTGRADVVDEIK